MKLMQEELESKIETLQLENKKLIAKLDQEKKDQKIIQAGII